MNNIFRYYIILPLSFYLVWGLPTHTTAQEPESTYSHVKKIKAGYLVVVLKGFRQKIQVLEERVDYLPTESRAYKRSKKLLGDALAYRNSINEALIRYSQEYYHFSDIRYIYDYNLPLLQAKKTSGYFLSSTMHVDSTIVISPDRSCYTFMLGQSQTIDNFGGSTWLIRTDSLKYIPDPFPGSIKAKFPFFQDIGIFLGISKEEDILVARLDHVFQRLDEDLELMYTISQMRK